MKRLLGVLCLFGMMAAPQMALAAEQVGVYVAPKFVYGLTQIEGTKASVDIPGVASGSLGLSDETDSAFGGSFAIGYDFEKKYDVPVRTELEYAVLSEVENEGSFGKVDGVDWMGKQSFGIQTLFLNAYWDIDTGTGFTPYIGAGLGMAFIDTDADTSIEGEFEGHLGSKNVTNFAWNAGVGLGYDFTENWTMDLGYRFVGLGSVKTKSYDEGVNSIHAKTDNLYQHQFSLGVRYTF